MVDKSTSGTSGRERSLRFGILTFSVGPYARLEREWTWAEELGFDSAWVPDTWTMSGLYEFEVWTLLAALARATSRLRIGSLVTTIMPRHPTLLAFEVLTVDHLSEGRVELGIGVGDQPEDCDVFGLPRWSPRERVTRLEEQLRLLDPLLRGKKVSQQGTYYPVVDVEPPSPRQSPRPPIVVAAEGKRALRLVAQYADAWVTLGGQPPTQWAGGSGERAPEAEALAATRSRLDRLDDHCVELGRDPASLRRMVLAYRQEVDPLSSLDTFDHFVGSYAELGIKEFVFYWPPIVNLRQRSEIAAEQREVVERIAESRLVSPRM